ncbi:MAG: hypothetical protein AB1584_03760 [Pseudomonadota bacterium]
MQEWIIAPLLATDPTGAPVRQPGKDGAGEDAGKTEEQAGDRRGGDRRDTHKDDSDAEFGRGEDRRDEP